MWRLVAERMNYVNAIQTKHSAENFMELKFYIKLSVLEREKIIMEFTFSIGGRIDDLREFLLPAGTGGTVSVNGSEIQRLTSASANRDNTGEFGIRPDALGLVNSYSARIVNEETTVLVDVVFQFELTEVARCR